jgi:nicotinamide-nucleotide amidase
MPSALAERLLGRLKNAGLKLAIAESLTGGMLASEFASIAGASDVLLGGVVAYNNQAKAHLLGVSSQTLSTFGAVSQEVALEMAQGAQETFSSANDVSVEQVVSVSTTGVAGPAQSEGKAVGTVYIAARWGDSSLARGYHFDGDRQQIRAASCQAAIELMLELLHQIN